MNFFFSKNVAIFRFSPKEHSLTLRRICFWQAQKFPLRVDRNREGNYLFSVFINNPHQFSARYLQDN
jgi:hypothetical protein